MNDMEFKRLIFAILFVLWSGVTCGTVTVLYAIGCSIGAGLWCAKRWLDNLWSF